MSVKGILNELVGFNQSVEELPKGFDTFNSKIKLRQLFLSLIEPIIKESCSFSLYEQRTLCNYSLESIFKTKIKSMLPISYIKPHTKIKKFKFDLASTQIINNYQNKQLKKNIYHYNTLLPVARVISLCYVNNKMQLLFDINLLFHQFVFNKVQKSHPDKYVIDSGDSICIIGTNCTPLKILTSWKNISDTKLDIEYELDTAIETVKQSEFKNVYLVYPKDTDFKKHQAIKVEQLEDFDYQIKVVPYSLRSTLRKIER